MAIEYRVGPTSLGTKDPDSKLDYTIDWSRYLYNLGGDIINQSEWLVTDGDVQIVTSPAPSYTDDTATVWLEGGTVGTSCTITNRITTAGGRIEDRSFVLTISEH